MARIRSLKPEFWTDTRVVALSAFARLLFQGMWNFAICDKGHLDDDAFALKLRVLPADQVDPVQLLDEVIGSGMVARRTMPNGRTYLHIVHLADHSRSDGRWSSRCPYCAHEASPEHVEPQPSSENLTETHASLAEPPVSSSEKGLGGFGFGDGLGLGGDCARDDEAPPPPAPPPAIDNPEPPLGCPKHPNGANGPCGPCADARSRHDAWERHQRDRPTPTPEPPHCPLHPRHPTGSKACPECAKADKPASPNRANALRQAVRKPQHANAKDPARC